MTSPTTTNLSISFIQEAESHIKLGLLTWFRMRIPMCIVCKRLWTLRPWLGTLFNAVSRGISDFVWFEWYIRVEVTPEFVLSVHRSRDYLKLVAELQQ